MNLRISTKTVMWRCRRGPASGWRWIGITSNITELMASSTSEGGCVMLLSQGGKKIVGGMDEGTKSLVRHAPTSIGVGIN